MKISQQWIFYPHLVSVLSTHHSAFPQALHRTVFSLDFLSTVIGPSPE